MLNYKSRCAIKTDKQIYACGFEYNLECLNPLVPLLTDIEGFDLLCDIVEDTNSRLIFLTSRPQTQQIPTDYILKYYKLDKYQVMYAVH